MQKASTYISFRLTLADFQFYSNQQWDSIAISHDPNIKVFYSDGTTTSGLYSQHLDMLASLFAFAPDEKRPISITLKEKTMEKTAKSIVEKMFAAFGSGDLEKFKETVSNDTIWIYHGTQEIPKATHEGKDRATAFINNILTKTEVISFEVLQFICEGNMVVVIGQEHQRVKASGKELKQKWVQVYTVENNLITRMEEYASSEVVKP